jgi:hypothetical protein
VDLFTNQFGKVLSPDGGRNPFLANPKVCAKVDLKKTLPPFISVMMID